jgi:hypothetical protein
MPGEPGELVDEGYFWEISKRYRWDSKTPAFCKQMQRYRKSCSGWSKVRLKMFERGGFASDLTKPFENTRRK